MQIRSVRSLMLREWNRQVAKNAKGNDRMVVAFPISLATWRFHF